MSRLLGLKVLGFISVSSVTVINSEANAQQPLYLAYPPKNHKTTADQIFLIGTASPQGNVTVNGQTVQRSNQGHFAPSFPLKVGVNRFVLRHNNKTINVTVTRNSFTPNIPQGGGFANNSLIPNRSISVLPNTPVCFSAIASPNAQVSVNIANQTIPLLPQPETVELPANSAILTDSNEPIINSIIQYQGCRKFNTIGNLGTPNFQLKLNNKSIAQRGEGNVNILNPNQLKIVEITADAGVARTGPSTNHSRLTPLPEGTIVSVIGQEGEWLHLDYGAWIKEDETKIIPNLSSAKAIIRSAKFDKNNEETKVIFPLTLPVPVSINQMGNKVTLTLYNTTAETDTIRLEYDPLIKSFYWQQVSPDKIEYYFELHPDQQWGYDLNYEGTNLVFTLRHPPKLENQTTQPLNNVRILLDPGHGGNEWGAKGPNGYPEKSVNLVVSKLLKEELLKRGATVYMTRETDKDVSLQDRVTMINKVKPDIALSIHYNALPDNGDAINTAGIGMFWYHPQAEDLSKFLHDYLVEKANRPSYGVFWNNLALTRPHIAPSVLLELGFMINPTEFEWITNAQQQKKLADILADGITEWFSQKQL
ncbi:N-acetylmuramoyl-L-alanine amidase [Crocosphaera subtropica ATCC 51142]|uniref:N-acetylmuramoyl-L-alanine amidase n=1 Tax=Crocosphaera subtropica (strain ATCC 51142 / BH68) TaxID=43989 RepID=B1X0G4_CROS5|nr:N-acetylmuramoyl-L-alanine amidase [Crocosphaera subtropica]ACB51253.1 N-acetylmuramoyl-L-alanine amidase [Crocosphaera subtropica ATCC 51142]